MRVVKISSAALLLLSLTGCGHFAKFTSPHPMHSPYPSPCAGNPFLQHYGCSFDRMENEAQMGDPDAQYGLGYMYFYGINTARDPQTGRVWIERSAAQGQPLAVRAATMLNLNNPPVTSVPIRHNDKQSTPGAPLSALARPAGGAGSLPDEKLIASVNANTTPSSQEVSEYDKEAQTPLNNYLPNYKADNGGPKGQANVAPDQDSAGQAADTRVSTKDKPTAAEEKSPEELAKSLPDLKEIDRMAQRRATGEEDVTPQVPPTRTRHATTKKARGKSNHRSSAKKRSRKAQSRGHDTLMPST